MRKEISLLGIRKKVILSHTKNKLIDVCIVMEAITDTQEERIDKSPNYFGIHVYHREPKNIEGKNILMYGEIDLNNKEDVDAINKLKAITDDYNSNIIHSNFNYDKGTFMTDEDDIAKRYPTNDVFNWFKYNYVLLGKPQKVVIFKCARKLL